MRGSLTLAQLCYVCNTSGTPCAHVCVGNRHNYVDTIDQEIFVVKKFSLIARATKIKRGKNFSTTKINRQNSTLSCVMHGSRTVHEARTGYRIPRVRCWLAFLPELSPKRTSGGPGGSHALSEART